jgi:uncharacterized membrane protein YphA (DoxX/SURF4 family)
VTVRNLRRIEIITFLDFCALAPTVILCATEPAGGFARNKEIPPMNPDPFSDTITFLVQPGLTTAIFWVLLVAGLAIAVYVYRMIPGQRDVEHVGNCAIRLLIGCMWWQQSLWKFPPNYDGLAYWMEQMTKHAAIPLQAEFVQQIVLPHLHLFAPIVYAAEVLTAVSLILGLFVRVWGLIGAAQILNLWFGLYSAPGEWPWTYFFLFVLMLVFALHRYGRSLGLDALLIGRTISQPNNAHLSRALAVVT